MGSSPRPYPSLDGVPGVPGTGRGCAGLSEECGRTGLMLALPQSGWPHWANANFSLSFLFWKVGQGTYFPDFTVPRTTTAQLTAAVTDNAGDAVTAGRARLTFMALHRHLIFTN